MATWTSAPGWQQRVDRAATGGLIAAANVLRNAVRAGLKPGYTTGDWVTGHVLNSVTISAVAREGSALVIRVGTNVKYALFWELGWSPSALHEIAGLAGGELVAPVYRKEVWRPALVDTRAQQAAAFARVFTRLMNGDAGAATVGEGAVETDFGLAEPTTPRPTHPRKAE